MKVIEISTAGAPEVLRFAERARPELGKKEVLIKVAAFALNRADIMQRKGLYPPPTSDSDIPGLEVAGTIIEMGSAVAGHSIGDRVCALVNGGGYADECVAHADMLIPLPSNMEMTTAAAIPEAYMTAWQALHWLANLQKEEKVLIHAGASSVGLAATQLAKDARATVITTASDAKHTICQDAGADHCIDYQNESFAGVIKDKYGGVNVIIDFVGAGYLGDNVKSLSPDGRMVILGLMGGLTEELHLGHVLMKRLKIMGSTLRARSQDYKIRLCQDFWEHCGPLFATGALTPRVDRVLPWDQIVEAHHVMERNENAGKIVMTVG